MSIKLRLSKIWFKIRKFFGYKAPLKLTETDIAALKMWLPDYVEGITQGVDERNFHIEGAFTKGD